LEGTFERRPNRYLAWVRVQEQSVAVHVPDPGRMQELLVPNRRVWVSPAVPSETRSTKFTLAIVELDNILVSINTLVPNQLVHRALVARALAPFESYSDVRTEVTHGRSRFDFVLSGTSGQCIVEVKSVGWVQNRVGLFPDAVSARATRHVKELTELRREGARTAIVFVAQRRDVDAIQPARDVDPAFATALKTARSLGVEVYGYRCDVSLSGIGLEQSVPIEEA
jgi:sugar fermentation stimulation protein A